MVLLFNCVIPIMIVSCSDGVCYRWQQCKVLIIDELSMISGPLFDKLEAVARAVKKNSLPFGGIQLILTGDFLQLPPIEKNGRPKYAFEANCWKTCVTNVMQLDYVFRQKVTNRTSRFFVHL